MALDLSTGIALSAAAPVGKFSRAIGTARPAHVALMGLDPDGAYVLVAGDRDVFDSRRNGATDEQIEAAISDYITEAASEQPWPSFTVDEDRDGGLLAAVKSTLAEYAAEDADV